MDRKKVMFDNQFLQNVESFIIMKGLSLPHKVMDKYESGKRIDFADLGRFVNGGENSSIEFINNTNQLIGDAMESYNKDLMQLAATAKIPTDFLGVDMAH